MNYLIQVAEGKWVNPRYVVAAVLHSDGARDTLTLTLDASTGVVEAYPDIRGVWIKRVMWDLKMIMAENPAVSRAMDAMDQEARMTMAMDEPREDE